MPEFDAVDAKVLRSVLVRFEQVLERELHRDRDVRVEGADAPGVST